MKPDNNVLVEVIDIIAEIDERIDVLSVYIEQSEDKNKTALGARGERMALESLRTWLDGNR